ncbi:GIY-YIG nuclease family protein [Hymenobacter artigasi]|uniref:Endonuclease n=1 Tax=Hymenobacter artigasi TaxID=2719616 RepID=A0ABX1HCP3_9BACT|nr:GIY-YIG nuclease family protein [Hymenobacter artigasi]NKI87735.1 putative endonuclease [Hymenobacter artigasi]
MAYFVCITTNPAKTVLYIGVTGSLNCRLAQHYDNRGDAKTFAGRYFCYHLLYADQFGDIAYAIAREKELKGWTRAKKDALIESVNPEREILTSY